MLMQICLSEEPRVTTGDKKILLTKGIATLLFPTLIYNRNENRRFIKWLGNTMGSNFPCGLTQMKKHINVLKLKTVLFGF